MTWIITTRPQTDETVIYQGRPIGRLFFIRWPSSGHAAVRQRRSAPKRGAEHTRRTRQTTEIQRRTPILAIVSTLLRLWRELGHEAEQLHPAVETRFSEMIQSVALRSMDCIIPEGVADGDTWHGQKEAAVTTTRTRQDARRGHRNCNALDSVVIKGNTNPAPKTQAERHGGTHMRGKRVPPCRTPKHRVPALPPSPALYSIRKRPSPLFPCVVVSGCRIDGRERCRRRPQCFNGRKANGKLRPFAQQQVDERHQERNH